MWCCKDSAKPTLASLVPKLFEPGYEATTLAYISLCYVPDPPLIPGWACMATS